MSQALRARLASEGVEFREIEWTGEGPHGFDTYKGLEIQPGYDRDWIDTILDEAWYLEGDSDIDFVDQLSVVTQAVDDNGA
jgi:hypothetical protein